jgi:hypothetical protein
VPTVNAIHSDNNSPNSNKNSHACNKKAENNKNECKKLNKPLKHCTVHGHNASHDSSECYTFKNQKKTGRQIVDAKANFSENFYCKKIQKGSQHASTKIL